jgi:hypothetical protein
MERQCQALYQGTTSVVPNTLSNVSGFSRCKACAGAKAVVEKSPLRHG